MRRALAAPVVAVGLAVVALGPVAPAAASGVGAPPEAGGAVVRMSNERTRTYTAQVTRTTRVRAAPRRSARRLATLRTATPLGIWESVVVLARTTRRGREWSRVRYAGLGRRKGWVPSGALSVPELVRTRLVIGRGARRLVLYRSGRRILVMPIGVGAASSPTPPGRYYVRERLVVRGRGGIYGPLAFGLSAYSRFRTYWPGGGQVGVHGTNEPGLIPGAISNGCVRLRNADILRLGRSLPVGTPVLVR